MKQEKKTFSLHFFRQQGSLGGQIGGSRSSAKLTPAERSEKAKKMVAAREAKRLRKAS